MSPKKNGRSSSRRLKIPIEAFWIAAIALLLVEVGLAVAAAGRGPLAFLGERGAVLVRPLFVVGGLVAGVATYRQFAATQEGRLSMGRRLLGLCLAVVGAACWALLSFALAFNVLAGSQ